MDHDTAPKRSRKQKRKDARKRKSARRREAREVSKAVRRQERAAKAYAAPGRGIRSVGEVGPPCPRCREPTEVWHHREITEVQLRRPYYYERWWVCANTMCRTTQIMPP